jgi:hypothetical protein
MSALKDSWGLQKQETVLLDLVIALIHYAIFGKVLPLPLCLSFPICSIGKIS